MEWTTSNKMKQTIIIPAYNEEKRIGKTLEAFITYYREKKDIETTILVAINNTKDKTLSIVKKYTKSKNPCITYINLIKGGKGYAVIEGFKQALKSKTDLIGFVDADLATSPRAFDDLRIHLGNFDGCIASRYLSQSHCHPKLTFRRAIVGKVFNLFVRLLLHLPQSDTQCGAKLFTRKTAQTIVDSVKMTQWAFDIELLYECKLKRYIITEVPTTWFDIEGSKVTLIRTSLQMFFAVLQLRIQKSRLQPLLRPLRKPITALWSMLKQTPL